MIKQKPMRQRLRSAALLVFVIVVSDYLKLFFSLSNYDGSFRRSNKWKFPYFLQGCSSFHCFLVGLWCGWICPAGALGEVCLPINNKPGEWEEN